ncbi:MAG TPA: hypothetical protein VKA19_15015 [Alphaproteobacteria bacterium]|nr:hypothetical protein [Alphaproteobacteria bacterium]
MQTKGPAKISSSLLARKGQALPSPGGRYSSIPAKFPQAAANTNERGGERLRADDDDLIVHHHAEETDDAAHAKKPVGDGPRIAMTVRLDHETHRRLRLLSAHTNKSSQDIFTEALENYMKQVAARISGVGCACLANPPSAE